jgi:hypothetical protein
VGLRRGLSELRGVNEEIDILEEVRLIATALSLFDATLHNFTICEHCSCCVSVRAQLQK